MSRYFLQGTPLSELEKIMIKTPHLRSPGMTILTDPLPHVAEGRDCVFCKKSLRKHCTIPRCLYIRERLDQQLVTYQQLVFQFFQAQGNGCLVTRVRTLPINEAGCVFLDEQHQRRVSEQLTANIQRGILVRSSCWLAVVFLLASKSALWSWGTSYFGNRSNKSPPGPLDIQSYAIYQAARGLQSGKRSLNTADLMDPELVSNTTFRLILDSAMIHQYGAAVFPRPWEIGL